VASSGVVEAFDEVEHGDPGVGAVAEHGLLLEQFAFEGGEELSAIELTPL
jgi:hypothetical protein